LKEEFITCECLSPEHILRFGYFEEDEGFENRIYVSSFLSSFSFWGRLWAGIKYICGYKCRFGHFEEYILNEDHAKKIVSLLNRKFDLD
jgi:hypothetical protein